VFLFDLFAFFPHWHSAVSVADGPDLGASAVSAVPGPDVAAVFPVVAGTFLSDFGFPVLGGPGRSIGASSLG